MFERLRRSVSERNETTPHEEAPLSVSLIKGEEVIDDRKYITFRPKFSGVRRPTEMTNAYETELTQGEYIGEIEDSEKEIINDVGDISYEEDTGMHRQRDVSRVGRKNDLISPFQKDGIWYLDARTPQTIQHIFAKALAHEALINPDLTNWYATLSIRLIKPEHVENWKDASQAHFDGPGASQGIYIVSSGPTTIQYGPESPSGETSFRRGGFGTTDRPAEHWFKEKGMEQGLQATSILPMKLYRFDGATLHSAPWDLFPETSNKPADEKVRFFCRISFVK